MTDLSALGSTLPAPTAAATTSTDSNTAAAALTSDFNTFLELLTAQVTNQDPLSPMDSTQFVEQLATFSGLEQQVTSNNHLESIIRLLQNSISGGSASLLGQSATSNAISVNGSFESLNIIAPGTTEGNLIVRNASGAAVFEGPNTTNWSWDGRDDNGDAVAPGTYSFSVQNGTTTIPASIQGTIDRVQLGDNGQPIIGFAEGVTAANYTLVS